MKKGILLDKLYVSTSSVNNKLYKRVVNRYTHEYEKFLQIADCRACNEEYKGEPPCDLGGKSACPIAIQRIPMYDVFKLRGKRYLSVWRGDIPKLLNTFKGFKIVDKRCTPRFKNKLKFTGKLRVYQIEAVLQWVRAQHGGMVEAPARSGKTVIGVFLACKLGLKTIVMVHQKDLADQFLESFEKFTNMKRFKNVIAIAKKGNIVDLIKQDYDVILTTYQTFNSPAGKIRLAQVRNKFGFGIVDESHLVGARCFSGAATGLNVYFHLGLTATPNRKDGKDVMAKHALGPVVSIVTPPQMVGHATFVHTGYDCGKFYNWATMLNKVAKNKKRTKIIIQYTLQDVKEGHCCLLVMERVKQVEQMYKVFKGYGIKVCMLHGKVPDRKKILDKLKKNKFQVTVATRKIVQYGLNVPPWSCYHCCAPTNNPPNFYQEMSRVRTPWIDPKTKLPKLTPLLRIYVDSFDASKRCMWTCKRVCKEQEFTSEDLAVQGLILKKVRKRDNPFNRFVGL